MKHFVLEYDRVSDKVVSLVQYDDPNAAAQRFSDLVALHVLDEVNVVFDAAESLAEFRAKYPQYFRWVVQ